MAEKCGDQVIRHHDLILEDKSPAAHVNGKPTTTENRIGGRTGREGRIALSRTAQRHPVPPLTQQGPRAYSISIIVCEICPRHPSLAGPRASLGWNNGFPGTRTSANRELHDPGIEQSPQPLVRSRAPHRPGEGQALTSPEPVAPDWTQGRRFHPCRTLHPQAACIYSMPTG